MNRYIKQCLTIFFIMSLTGCAREMGADVYSSNAPVGKVLEGTLVSSRLVTIKDSDKLQNNTAGILGGGILGGVAGSGLGKGTGSGIAAVGGALLGGVAGAYAQDKLGTSQGVEYIIRIDNKYINEIPENTLKERITAGEASVDSEIKDSIKAQSTKTNIISIIQAKEKDTNANMTPGQRVLIIYHNDRPRVVPAV